MLAVIASQATGCIITSGDDDDVFDEATITAQWSFKNVANNQTTGCPNGFNTVALHSQELDAADNPIGLPIIDLFDCIDTRHDSAPLPASVYESWIEVTTSGGASLYAKSLSAIVDVTQVDKTFSATILNDGGYFQVGWNLRGAQSGAPLQCRDIPNIDGVEIISTVTGGTQAVVDKFDCEAGIDVSDGLLQGSYTVSVDAFQDGAGALGPPVNLTNRAIRDRNGVTDLGTVTLPITGK
jgi:hypothetical protein